MTPNMLFEILCMLTAATEAGLLVSVTEFLELFNIWDSRKLGTFTVYNNLDKNLIHGLLGRDNNWWNSWYLFKIDTSSINGLVDMIQHGWATIPGRN